MVNFMSMAMGSRATVFLLPTLFWLWLSSDTCNGVESDIQCLRDLKASMKDTFGYLSSWNFSNTGEGLICTFNGIECWHPDENKVLNIHLSDMGLKGSFPLALKNCTSMTGLDLSGNELSGTIPHDIDTVIPYVTVLNLSSNNFMGEIPAGIVNLTYLNALNLQNNRLTGQIPWRLGQLSRLKTFSVANNSLSGPIPHFVKAMTPSSFANNSGLCEEPWDSCKGRPKMSHTRVIIGAAIVGTALAVIVVGVIFVFGFGGVPKQKNKEEDLEGNNWAKTVKETKDTKSEHTSRRYGNVHVSTFEKTVPRMRLNNLLKATNNFSKNNIIGSGRAGTVYKAMLLDGSSLAIKRLHDSQHSDIEFMSEMIMLGRLQHHNVVPLVGFCIARNERLLVYKYMPKGTLYQQLHERHMEWPLRLRIAIGVSRGLAWLHHSCDPCIIHRKISSKRILLDEDYEPKISKFRSVGLMNPLDTNLSVRVNIKSDDIGFVAPEFRSKVVASRAGDVYSFGVVLLELITGQKPTKVVNAPKGFKGILVEWIAYLEKNSHLRHAIDRSLIGKGCDDELLRFLRIAVACTAFDPEERPTMLAVYGHLKSFGKRYHFIDEDHMQRPQVRIEMDGPNQLNVGQHLQEIWQNRLNM